MNHEETTTPQEAASPQWEPAVFKPPTPSPAPVPPVEIFESHDGSLDVSDPAPSEDGPGLVRVEFHLQPDQMASFFRAVASTQHPVLTVREAAAQLRISPQTLQTLTEAGKVPGFQIDGRWRYAKNQLDAWIAQQQEGFHAA